MATRIVVRPAGAGHETLWVALWAALILAVAATVVVLRTDRAGEQALPAHQIDARRDLTAAEQGVYADLLIAADEIPLLDHGKPAVAALADAGLPPFATDVSSAKRGGHVWSRLQDGTRLAFAGVSADAGVAGSMLLRIAAADDGHGHAAAADVWLRRSPKALPARLDDASLVEAGWLQVVARFDAGVTRQSQD